MKKQTCIAALVSALLVSALAGILLVNSAAANPVYQKGGYTTITMQSPQQNQAYSPNNLAIEFTVKTNVQEAYPYCYVLDGSWEYLSDSVWNNFLKVNQTLVSEVVMSGDSPASGYSRYPLSTEYTWNCSGTLPRLSEGTHSITIYCRHAVYYPLLIVYFNVSTPPVVTVLSLENKTYDAADVPLDFTVSKPCSSVAYSLDGRENVTITGSTTLTGLSSGEHSVIIYAWDALGSVGASETIFFTMASFPTALIAVASASVVAIGVLAGVLMCFQKHNRKMDPPQTT